MSDKYRNPSSLPVQSLKLNPLNARKSYGFLTLEEADHIVNSNLSDDEIEGFKSRLEALPDEDKFKSLLLDISARGVKQVITVNRVDENFYHPVEGGNHRVLCAHFSNKVLGSEIRSIPAKVAPLMSEEQQLVAQWAENNLRMEASDSDKAILFQRLLDKGWEYSDIAKSLVGTTVHEIKRVLKLLVLETAALDVVREGSVKTQAVIDAITTAEEFNVPQTELSGVVSAAVVEAAKEAITNGKSKATGAEVSGKVRKSRNQVETSEESGSIDDAEMVNMLSSFDWKGVNLKDLVKVYNIATKYL